MFLLNQLLWICRYDTSTFTIQNVPIK